ncbi:MAG: PAS domain S-box protein, partial [Candidatus Sericytochromatia bacterium]
MGIQDFKPTDLAFRRLMEAAPDGVVIVDGRGRMIFVNQQTNLMFGYTGHELVGQLIEVLVPERFRDRHVSQRDGYIEHPRPRLMAGGLRLSGRRKDGTELPVEIALSPLETDDGVVTTAFIRDVTDRVRSEDLVQQAIRLEADRRAAAAYAQKLALNEERHRSFVLATATITWATDAEGRMVLADANQYAIERFKPAALVNIATLTG